jgi:hypothetical protein
MLSEHAQVVVGEVAAVFFLDEGDIAGQVPVERLDLGRVGW